MTSSRQRSASQLVAEYRRGSLSPTEVVEQTLRSIDASDLNAFWRTDPERALNAARASERAYASGTQRPLEGVPLGVKDIFDTEGLETTSGSSMYRGRIPDRDANAVAALRRAGAIVVGKTATHEFAFGVTTVNPHFGTTHHPTHRGRIVGGSSGGSAAAVAAGLVPIALGSDTSVSIREPSAFCGCVGLRPTHDTVSLRGAMALAPSFDTAGPIGATVADVASVAEALWTHAPGLAGSPHLVDAIGHRSLRIGVMQEGWPLAPVAEIRQAVHDAGDTLSALGHQPIPVVIREFERCSETFSHVMLPEALEVHRRLELWPGRAAEYGADTAVRLRGAESITFEQHCAALADRRSLRERMHDYFTEFDLLLTPATAIVAPTIEDRDNPEYNGVRHPVRDLLFPFQVPAPLCAMPALALPIGRGASGLPTSVLLSAAPRHDRLLLQVGSQLMKEFT